MDQLCRLPCVVCLGIGIVAVLIVIKSPGLGLNYH